MSVRAQGSDGGDGGGDGGGGDGGDGGGDGGGGGGGDENEASACVHVLHRPQYRPRHCQCIHLDLAQHDVIGAPW